MGDMRNLFFLQLEKKLPPFYFDLSWKLKKMGVTLIPIKRSQLSSLLKYEGKLSIILYVDSLTSLKKSYNFFNSFLKFLLFNNLVTLFYLGSDNIIDSMLRGRKNNNFFKISLPQNVDDIFSFIKARFTKAVDSKLWPGGKKSSLFYRSID